jgi:plastocyanin
MQLRTIRGYADNPGVLPRRRRERDDLLKGRRPMRIHSWRRMVLALCLGAASGAGTAAADAPLRIAVTIQNHVFAPSEIHVPAGKPAVLVVTNRDAQPEEFDSTALQVEKVIVGGTYATIRLRPLAPGRYPFMGEFHPASAQGAVR